MISTAYCNHFLRFHLQRITKYKALIYYKYSVNVITNDFIQSDHIMLHIITVK